MVGWMKMPLAREVGFSPSDTVLDGTHVKGHSNSPLLGLCPLWPNGQPSQQLLCSCYMNLSSTVVYFFCYKTLKNRHRIFSIPINRITNPFIMAC